MSKINDKSLENLLTINSHYVMEAIGDTISFEDKSDKERDEILKASLKSIEIASVLTCKFFDSESFDTEKLEDISKHLLNKKFDLANDIMAKDT